ncbi:MAG: hypothetical protein AAF417_22155 [Pseudomonadota bacterium]
MSSTATAVPAHGFNRIQQFMKWTVYLLLVVNFAFYVYEDWDRAIHTLTPDSPLLKWTSEFATTIDTSAWLILLLMFELETYVLEDVSWKGWVARMVRGTRVVCFVLIGHTVFAFANGVVDYQKNLPFENTTSLCDLADEGLSFVYNLEYTDLTSETCTELSEETQFYRLGNNPLVTTYDGLQLERYLVWSDLIEIVAWILIILAMEIVVRLQGNDVASGPAITVTNNVKLALYGFLVILAVFWAWLSHWLYTWDTFVWIAGFATIEMNVSEWRSEILDQEAAASA